MGLIYCPTVGITSSEMNLVFLFLTRDDLAAIPRISPWLSEMPEKHTVWALVNPHLAIDPSPEQVGLEDQIIRLVSSPQGHPDTDGSDRINLELMMQKRWMQIPRDVMLDRMDEVFRPFGITRTTGLVTLSESFQSDRLPELLMKMRPAWPANIPLGQFVLVFPNQIPHRRGAGRPPGRVIDEAKRAKMRANLEKARAARKKNKEATEAVA